MKLITIIKERVFKRSDLSLRSGRQHKAWGGAEAEPQEYGVTAHQAREAGGSFLLFAI